MATSFDKIVDDLLVVEGGYAEKDVDNGCVNFGITQTFIQQISTMNAVEAANYVKHLDRDSAREIYRKHFWVHYRLGEVESPRIAKALLFAIVNMTPYKAIALAQQACNMHAAVSIVVDGVMGKATLSALNSLGDAREEAWLKTFSDLLTLRYIQLAASSPEKYQGLLDRWKRRVQLSLA